MYLEHMFYNENIINNNHNNKNQLICKQTKNETKLQVHTDNTILLVILCI